MVSKTELNESATAAQNPATIYAMNLYLISQKANDDYDTYDSAVVAAPDEETARHMDPSGGEPMKWGDRWTSWAYAPEQVTVELIGIAVEGTKQGVVCASYNAG